MKLIKGKFKKDATYCDIGSENGIIAKTIAKSINAAELHMIEPFGTECRKL